MKRDCEDEGAERGPTKRPRQTEDDALLVPKLRAIASGEHPAHGDSDSAVLLDAVVSRRSPELRPLAAKAISRCGTVDGGAVDAVCQSLSAEALTPTLCTRTRAWSVFAVCELTVGFPLAAAPRALAAFEALNSDPHPRLRRAAFGAALAFLRSPSASNNPTTAKLFFDQSVTALLSDSDSAVRSAAVDTISALCSGQTLRVATSTVDGSFLHLCAAIATDQSSEVRSKACRCLSTLTAASPSRIVQSLTKKPLGIGDDLREDSLPSLALATGDIDVTKARFSLTSLESTAAGALVHAVEDECYQVREAAIDALCELGLACELVTDRAVDTLTDMLTESIDSVRVRAVHALKRTAVRSPITQEQLHTLLSSLEESSAVVRRAVHSLLSSVPIPNDPLSTLAVVQALLSNLQKHAEDRDSIYATLRDIGRAQHEHIGGLVNEVLRIDPRFAPVESNADDPIYTGCAIVLFNAAGKDNSILAKLPKFVISHERYFRDRFPSLFQAATPLQPVNGETYDIMAFFGRAISLAYCEAPRLLRLGRRGEAARLLREATRDIRRSAVLDSALLSPVKFHLTFLGCAREFLQRPSAEGSAAIVTKTYLIEHVLFRGLPPSAVLALRWMRCVAVLSLMLSEGSAGSSSSVESLAKRVEAIGRFCRTNGLQLPDRFQELLSGSSEFLDASGRSTAVAGCLLSVLSSYFPSEPFAFGTTVERVFAEVVSPECNPDKPAEFHPSLPHCFTPRFRISNMSPGDVPFLRVRLQYPSGDVKFVPVLQTHVAQVEGERDAVDIAVPATLSWTRQQRADGAVCVDVSLVKSFPAEALSPDEAILGTPVALPLCSVKYFVFPSTRSTQK